ncbi:hypothetical protein COHA_000668 [Chlorella ohadii]|uniref:NodB homology domain-containing protein n=1 Tax=Chlorella ohadii TaxID=2649997 RepID=A0AAD5DZP6_9CHLO|nr:hypothetical protein COHA_000668 [Chlorella ohadii]
MLIMACSLLGTLGAAPSWYSCDCGGRPNCMCPSIQHPAADRIPLQEVPQFVLFTHDDAIVEKTDASMRAVCDGRYNPNGCPARATMFTMQYNTDCDLAYRMWKDGYEISDHTVTHPPMDSSMDKETARQEIAGMREWAQESCGIPAAEILGFRNPYLTTTPTVRQVLHEEGFLYDSTLMETLQYSLSNGAGQRVWPYTMDFGIAQNCAFFSPAQKCNPQNETYPGLWQVPMWPLIDNGQETMMDYGPDDDHSLYNLLVANFEESLSGNRAPLPVFIHTPWFTERRLAQVKRFADYSIGKGAYWVTIRQLINWMRNPVPASQLRLSQAMCGRAPSPPPPAPPAAPLPSSGLNITLIFQGGDQAQLAARKPVLEALVSSLLGGGPAVASVRQVTRLSSLPSRTAVGRKLQAAARTPAAPPPALDIYGGSGARLAVMQHEAPGGHLQSSWRLLAGGTEVSFGERSGDSVASFLQYEAASAAGEPHDISMASMQGISGTVAAANLAAGMPGGMLPQPVAAGGAAAGQQAGVGVRPQGSLPGSLPAGQQAIPGLPQAAVPGNPALQQPGGKQQPRGPAANGGMAGQPAGMGGPQPGAAAANGAALWQAVGQLQAGVPGAGQAPVAAAPSSVATQPSVQGLLQVTLMAAAADPLALYNTVAPRFRDGSLAAKLAQVGLQLAAEPELVPFKNGWALLDEQHKTVRHSPPPPSPQPPASQAPAGEPALGDEAQTDQPATNEAGYGEEASSSGSSSSLDSSSSSSGGGHGSSSIAGLPIGTFVGVVAGATAAVAALAVLAAVVLSRRSKAHRAAAGKPAAAGSSAQPAHGPELADPKSPRARQHNIQLEASSHQEAPHHQHMM